MKYTDNILKKKVVVEEYLPLKIKSDLPLDNANYLIFRHEDNSLLEIAFDEQDGNIYRIDMIICKNYHIVDANFNVPNDSRKGDLIIEREEDITTPKFECIIYKDAIRVEMSNGLITERIDSINILWELNNEGMLSSFTLYGQSTEVIDHTINELEYDNQ